MNSDEMNITLDTAPLKKRRPWYLLALILLVVSLIVQQPLIFLSAFFVLLIGIVPDLWYRHALRHLVIDQHINPHQIFFGEEATLSMSIENQKLLPLPWLRLENPVAPSLTVRSKQATQREKLSQIGSTWLLWSFQRMTRHYRLRCYARGLYSFGPVKLRSSDPFGWLECEVSVPVHETLLVYPLIAPLEALGLTFLHPFGEQITPRRLLEDPLRVAGVRDYQLGDDPRRIHWKASAHAGELRSKIYEYSSLQRLLILLDTENYSKAWMGSDQEIQELTITIAASLAMWAMDEGYMVGLLTNSAVSQHRHARVPARDTPTMDEVSPSNRWSMVGVSLAGTLADGWREDSYTSVPFAQDAGQYERLLSTLASLAPDQHMPMAKIMAMEHTMLPPGTTIMLISAASTLNEDTVEHLLDLQAEGSSVHLVLAGKCEPKNMIETYDLPVHTPGGREKWHELLQNIHAATPETIRTGATSLSLD